MKLPIINFDNLNEIVNVIKMNQAEKVLLRGKSDLIKLISDNLLTVAFILLILFLTWVKIFSIYSNSINFFELTVIIGLISLLTRKMSRKALEMYIWSIIKYLINVVKQTFILIRKLISAKSNHFWGYKYIFPICKLILFPLIFTFFILFVSLVFIITYGLGFIYLFILNNEVVSFIISFMIVFYTNKNFEIGLMSLIIPVVPIYAIINFTNSQLKMTFEPIYSKENGFEYCVGKLMSSELNGKRLYFDKESDVYIILYNKENFAQFYTYTSKYLVNRKKIYDFIIKVMKK